MNKLKLLATFVSAVIMSVGFFGLYEMSASASGWSLLLLPAIVVFAFLEGLIIHRLSKINIDDRTSDRLFGILNVSKMKDKELDVLNKYWAAAWGGFTVVGIGYVTLYPRQYQDVTIIVVGLIFTSLIVIKNLLTTNRIKGLYKKEELFK